MKLIIVAACLIAVTAALPAKKPVNGELVERRMLPALKHEEIHDDYGQYALRYITAEGSVISERGKLVPTPDGKSYVLVIDGETTFISDDGKTYVTKYSAGLDGSHVQGAHLPVSN